MTEKDLILKLNKLSVIKPNLEWVALTKNQILVPEFKENVLANKVSFKERFITNLNAIGTMIQDRKLAYSFSAILLIAVSVLGFAKFTVPGDTLFSVKKVSEQSTAALLPASSQLQQNFVLANKRLQDLTQIIKENKVSNLAPAIDEFRQSVALVAKNLNNNISTQNNQELKQIAVNIKKLKDGRKELVLSGLAINDTKESKDLDTAESILVQRLIEDLDKTTLTKDQEAKMLEIKDLYASKEYGTALEEILTINN